MLYPAKHFVALCLLQTAMIRAFCSAPGARRVMRLPKLKHATPLSHEFNSQLRSRQYLSGGITATVETSMSPRHPDSQLFSENQQQDSQGSIHHDFQRGDQVQVEIVSFGPLGASVDVVGLGHDTEPITLDQEPYGYGLIIQEEISYFRQGRGNVDVVTGEIIPAYVQHIRPDDGKLSIGLRSFGGKAKAEEVSSLIVSMLEASADGTLSVGDKSSPDEINRLFPGVSKSVFKKAVGALYKKGLVDPQPKSISLKS